MCYLLSMLTNTGPAKYALDHDHKTGSVRDCVCSVQRRLGNFNEDPACFERLSCISLPSRDGKPVPRRFFFSYFSSQRSPVQTTS